LKGGGGVFEISPYSGRGVMGKNIFRKVSNDLPQAIMITLGLRFISANRH